MNEQVNSYLTFSLGNENFAIEISQVEKILEFQTYTEVPKAPDYMLGVINIRGEVIPLIDTRLKFGMKATEVLQSTCILVINITSENDKLKLGAIVDSVNEVVKYKVDEISPLPTVGKQNKTEFISGVLKVNNNFILALNCDKIFSVDEIIDLKIENLNLTE